MAMYKAYPEYKDSGIEWLGDIPTHWICTQIKYGYDITLGKMLQKNKSSSKDELKPYLKAQNIQPTGIDLSVVDNMWFSPDEKNKLLLKKNDVLISEGGDVGRSAIWQGQLVECYIQNAINRARAMNGNSPYFLNYWMVYLKSSDFINTLCNKATIAHYTAEKVESSPLLLPNSDEQLHISLFLDHETAKIDNLIAKQQQLIELLKEKRQAVISHAVTKGLDPNVPMKDSGVEWLGEVPAHWAIKRLKHISPKVGVGLVINPSTYTKDEGVYFIFGGDVKEFGFDLTKTRRISPQDSNKLLPSRLNSRDLVSVRVGYPGITSVVTDDLEGSNCASIIIIRRGSYNSDWLCAAMNVWVGRQQVDLASYGAAQKQFNVSDAIEFVFPVPPINEQNDIADFVQKTLNKFDDLTQKALKQIELLQERRTALISAAVTGKIDVRDWVAPDTQDVEEPQEATA
ncbi:restriction endonuclease subunit S [Pantoea agglomerans]|uniref:restriction endonuclease subunit S n=1 Tax=Enterobacter agglomerans TaxID=549 RepID=UPI003C79A823